MRKIINSTYITVDGVIQNPQDWPSLDVDHDRSFTIQAELLFACDAVLMGRRTYEAFASTWPERSGDPYSDQINGMSKYVVSSTLQDPKWNNTSVIDGDVVGEVRRLKEQPGKDIVQYGFGPVSDLLLDNGLLDQLRLWVHPFLIRRGGPDDLLYREGPLTNLKLTDTTALPSGTVILAYDVERP